MGDDWKYMKIVIATLKSWNICDAHAFMEKYAGIHEFMLVEKKENLDYNRLVTFSPDYIFFPHWSYIIPDNIWNNFECVVFHMTDLPFGRGGSPLQNLIVRGYKETKISAIRVVGELDAGPVYLKQDLLLKGSAEDIFYEASKIIFEKMMPYIINNQPTPVQQIGEPVLFKRRTPEQSRLEPKMASREIYDQIRMLDAEGYPNAYIEFGNYRLDFCHAELSNDVVSAQVVFRRKADE